MITYIDFTKIAKKIEAQYQSSHCPLHSFMMPFIFTVHFLFSVENDNQ